MKRSSAVATASLYTDCHLTLMKCLKKANKKERQNPGDGHEVHFDPFDFIS